MYRTKDNLPRNKATNGGPHAHISPIANFNKRQEESSVK